MNTTLPPLPETSILTCANRLEWLASSVASSGVHAALNARELRRALTYLKTRPNYELMSEAYLAEAEKHLTAALDEVVRARQEFVCLTVGSHYMEAAE